MAFKIFRKNCCGLDVHKTWIYACIGITDINNRTEYKQARFSSFSKGLQELSDWLAKYSCYEVCMESFCGSLSGLRLPQDVRDIIPMSNKVIVLFDIIPPLEFSCFYYYKAYYIKKEVPICFAV